MNNMKNVYRFKRRQTRNSSIFWISNRGLDNNKSHSVDIKIQLYLPMEMQSRKAKANRVVILLSVVENLTR